MSLTPSHATPLFEKFKHRYRRDRRIIRGYREGFKQILNCLESAHARFEARLNCRK